MISPNAADVCASRDTQARKTRRISQNEFDFLVFVGVLRLGKAGYFAASQELHLSVPLTYP
jgi:hypothetical protein